MTFDIFPTLEQEVRLSPPERLVTLIAACEPNQIGRFNVREVAHQPPTGVIPRQGKEETLVFTSSVVRAQTDSTSRVMVFVGIKKKYLTKIPESLNGWSCPRGTPMQVIKVQHGLPTLKLSFLHP
ncbi:MAG TPA: hypothetical protein VJ889_18405 [Pseudomonas sp.]|nr:hypothetical protein [Pseudomonas sp.]